MSYPIQYPHNQQQQVRFQGTPQQQPQTQLQQQTQFQQAQLQQTQFQQAQLQQAQFQQAQLQQAQLQQAQFQQQTRLQQQQQQQQQKLVYTQAIPNVQHRQALRARSAVIPQNQQQQARHGPQEQQQQSFFVQQYQQQLLQQQNRLQQTSQFKPQQQQQQQYIVPQVRSDVTSQNHSSQYVVNPYQNVGPKPQIYQNSYTPVNSTASTATAATAVINPVIIHAQQAAPAMPKKEDLSQYTRIIKVLDKLGPADTPETKNIEEVIRIDAEDGKAIADVKMDYSQLLKRKRMEIDYYNQILPLRQSHPGSIFDGGYSGYGNRWTGNQFKIIYPRDRKKSKSALPQLNLTSSQIKEISETPEILVPIRLDFESDKYRLHDTFTWNLNEKNMSVAQFAENITEDFYFPRNLSSSIVPIITDQIKEFNIHPYVDTSKLKNKDIERDEDMRIIIKLDITVGQHNLMDQFEWDINCPDNNPEKFAEVLCKELNLSGEFATAIAHSIREQQQVYTKSLVLIGHEFDGTPIEDEDISREFLPTIDSDILRSKSNAKDYSPSLVEIDDSELERQDRDRDRESRRKRRQGRAGRRGGPALPDFKDLIKTFRTPVFSSMLPGAVDHNDELMRQINGDSDDDDNDDEIVSSTTRRSRAPLNHHHYHYHNYNINTITNTTNNIINNGKNSNNNNIYSNNSKNYENINNFIPAVNSSNNRNASWFKQQPEHLVYGNKTTPQFSSLPKATSQVIMTSSNTKKLQSQLQSQSILNPQPANGNQMKVDDAEVETGLDETGTLIVKFKTPKLKNLFTDLEYV